MLHQYLKETCYLNSTTNLWKSTTLYVYAPIADLSGETTKEFKNTCKQVLRELQILHIHTELVIGDSVDVVGFYIQGTSTGVTGNGFRSNTCKIPENREFLLLNNKNI